MTTNTRARPPLGGCGFLVSNSISGCRSFGSTSECKDFALCKILANHFCLGASVVTLVICGEVRNESLCFNWTWYAVVRPCYRCHPSISLPHITPLMLVSFMTVGDWNGRPGGYRPEGDSFEGADVDVAALWGCGRRLREMRT